LPSIHKKIDLRYTLLRECYRWVDKLNNWRIKRKKSTLIKSHEVILVEKSQRPKVYVHDYGPEWLYLSSLRRSFSFDLVFEPDQADIVVFLSLVDERLNLQKKEIFFFYGEPSIYSKLHFAHLSPSFFNANRVTVISHHPSPEYFLSPTGPFQFIRAALYPPFLHGATAEQLDELDNSPRLKKIFTITSALSGISGNDNKKKNIEKLAQRDAQLDVYGRFSRAAYSIKNYRGPCAYKYRLLGQYKYNLILENSPEEEWYITEKVYDALLCGCMPIFHGSDKIYDLLPAEWFYHLPSFEDDDLDKLDKFMNSDAYLLVANNRKQIADYIDRHFSFYAAIEKVASHLPLEFCI